MSLLTQEMRRTYAAQRGVSQGAHITLAAVSGGFSARFECAQRAAGILGDRNMENGLLTIPLQDAYRDLNKLAEKFSIALVDVETDEQGSRFVLVWRIAARVPVGEPVNLIKVVHPHSSAFGVIIQNSDPLDEY